METIKLFRGDSTKVAEFSTKKTNKYCLLGSGIYLTDSSKIAQSYRVKDAKLLECTISKKEVEGPFNRPVVLEMAFTNWLALNYYDELGYVYDRRGNTTMTKLQQVKAKYRNAWQNLIDTNQIVAKYLTQDSILVEQKPAPQAGYMSVFEFFREEFEPLIFKVDGAITDPDFLEFAKDSKIFEDTVRKFDIISARGSLSYDSGSIHIPTHMYSRCLGTKSTDKMRSYLKGRGFKGMEYNGGILIGGYGTHRAFCVWDDAWVNYHKTNRYK